MAIKEDNIMLKGTILTLQREIAETRKTLASPNPKHWEFWMENPGNLSRHFTKISRTATRAFRLTRSLNKDADYKHKKFEKKMVKIADNFVHRLKKGEHIKSIVRLLERLSQMSAAFGRIHSSADIENLEHHLSHWAGQVEDMITLTDTIMELTKKEKKKAKKARAKRIKKGIAEKAKMGYSEGKIMGLFIDLKDRLKHIQKFLEKPSDPQWKEWEKDPDKFREYFGIVSADCTRAYDWLARINEEAQTDHDAVREGTVIKRETELAEVSVKTDVNIIFKLMAHLYEMSGFFGKSLSRSDVVNIKNTQDEWLERLIQITDLTRNVNSMLFKLERDSSREEQAERVLERV